MAGEDKSTPTAEALSPFWLKSAFPDAQGIFDARHRKLAEIKDECFVALDANVLLLPYKLENVGLADVVAVYRRLADANRLVIPAQAAREFAKHRSAKVAEVVKYLRDEASLLKPVLKKKVGALAGHAGYEAAKAKVEKLVKSLKEAQAAINEVADEVAADVGEDPVSNAYRELFAGAVVEDPADCLNEAVFKKDLRARFEVRRPPGYKDGAKDDDGAGDLILWKTVLAEGSRRSADCILVTGEEKPDWHVQLNGPFQPRLELLEEYRAATSRTLHIVPLSQLLKTFSAPAAAVESVRQAEAGETPVRRQARLLREAESQRISAIFEARSFADIKAEISELESGLDALGHVPVNQWTAEQQGAYSIFTSRLRDAQEVLALREGKTSPFFRYAKRL